MLQQFENNPVLTLSFECTLKIIAISEHLEKNQKCVLAGQLLRSGTSIGVNIIDAQNTENSDDFIHKMKIAAKECGETHYWLLLIKASYQEPDIDQIISQIESLSKLIGSIIHSAKVKQRLNS